MPKTTVMKVLMLYFQDFKMEEKNLKFCLLIACESIYSLKNRIVCTCFRRQALKKTAKNKILALYYFTDLKKLKKITILWSIHLYSLLLRGKLPIADIFAKGHIKFSKIFFQKKGEKLI